MNQAIAYKLVQPSSNKRKLRSLCAWIDTNIDKPIGWTDLSEQSGMDHMELQRQFNVYLKTSPMQWIRHRRVERRKVSMEEVMGNSLNGDLNT